MKTIFRVIPVLFLALALSVPADAQSKNFKLAKWTEIYGAIVKELNHSYVDTLPVDRMQRAAVDAMLEQLDPYTVYIPEEENEDLRMMINKSYGGIGAVIYKPDVDGNVIINEPYENSPAHKNGLSCGDEIIAINSESTHGLTSAQASEKMRGEPHTNVVFTVRKLRTGDTLDVNITRESIHLPDIEFAGMIDEQTGYVCQSGFTEGVSDELRRTFLELKSKGMKKFILDLRGNGGGLLQEAVNIVSLFVPKGSVVVTSKGPAESHTWRTTKEPVDLKMPVIILVDSGSASASEIVSGALQDLDRATIMGHRTFGKGLVQSIRSLPYNGQIKLTTAKYYTPSGRCVQAIDYSNRNEDGSVGAIPDSLTHEFHTAAGRTVRDGGGITPDVELEGHEYSRVTYSVVLGGIIEQYALQYVRNHESIPAVKDFHFTEFDDFLSFARDKEFDYRSFARTYFDQTRKELEKDGLLDAVKEQMDALEKALDMDKETVLRLKKDELIPFIEEEIVVRYYFQSAGIELRLRYDDQLKQALQSPLI